MNKKEMMETTYEINSKRIIFSLLIWIISIGVGLFFNEYVLSNSRWYDMNLLTKYIFQFSLLLSFAVAGAVLFNMDKMELNQVKLHPLAFVAFSIPISIGLALFRSYCHMGNTIINGCFILFIYSLAYMSFIDCYKRKYGYLWAIFIFLILFLTASVATNVKMILFTLTIYALALLLGIKIFKPSKKFLWIISWIIICCLTFALLTYVVETRSHVMNSILGFYRPKSVPEYNSLINWITDYKWFDFFLNNTFTDDINSLYAAPYGHLLVSFGLIPTMLFIFSQGAALTMMLLESIKFKDKQRKFLGIVSVGIMIFHFLLSVSSSFCRGPLIELGGTFITIVGLEYCIIPAFFFYILWFGDKKVKFLDVIKHYFKSKRKDCDIIYLDDFDLQEEDKKESASI